MRAPFITIGLAAALAAGCGSDPRCIEGRSLECACPDGTTGAQICTGGGFGACSCDPGPNEDAGGSADAGSRGDAGERSDAGRDGGVERNDAGNPYDAGPRRDAGPRGMDAGGPGADAGPGRTDAGRPRADAGRPPPTDAGSGRSLDDWIMSRARWVTELCACEWERAGFDSVEDCEAEYGLDPMVASCARTALLTADPEIREHFDCQTLAYEEAETCHSTVVDCRRAMVTTCETTLETDLELCVSPGGYSAFLGSVSACLSGFFAICPDMSDFAGVSGTAVMTGTTVGAIDDFDGSCGDGPAPDRSLFWTSPRDSYWIFDTHGSEFDTVLYVMDALSCATATELECNDDSAAHRVTSSIEMWLSAGQTVIIVVDGKGLAAGRFQLNITVGRGTG